MTILGLFLTVVPLLNPPDSISQAHIDAIWEYVERVSGDESLPPIITFTDAEGALGFYYEGTNQIHISPHALSTRTVNPPSQGTGFVYVVIGHEMFHYAYRRSIPMERHHFYFKHYLQDRLIKWLVDKEIVLPIMGRIIKGMEMEE